MPGEEVAVEALLRGGRLEVLAVFDKPDPLTGPYFEETLYVTPSRLPEAVQAEIAAAVAEAAAAIGLTRGARPRRAADRPRRPAWLLELAARTIGGLCARTLRFAAGVTLEELVLRHALGLPLDPRREHAAAGVMMLPIPRAGRLVAVHGQDEARAVPGITALETVDPPRAATSAPSPKATATWASSSPGPPPRPKSNRPCGPPTPTWRSSSTPQFLSRWGFRSSLACIDPSAGCQPRGRPAGRGVAR